MKYKIFPTYTFHRVHLQAYHLHQLMHLVFLVLIAQGHYQTIVYSGISIMPILVVS